MNDHQAIAERLIAEAKTIYDPGTILPSVFGLDCASDDEPLFHLIRIDTSIDRRDAGAFTETVLGRHHDGARLAQLAAHMTTLRSSIECVWQQVWRDHAADRHIIYPLIMEAMLPWDPTPLGGMDVVTYRVRQTARIPVLDLSSFTPTPAIHTHCDVGYAPCPNTVTTLLDGAVPPSDLTRTSFVILLDDQGRPLLADNARRGLEVPGGHIEAGEDAEAAARREAHEETGAHIGELVPLGSQLLISQGNAPVDWKYPFPVARQAFFAARIVSLDPYEPNDECVAPRFIDNDAEIPHAILPFVLAARQALGIPKV